MRPGAGAWWECVNPAIPHNWNHHSDLAVGSARRPLDPLYEERADVGVGSGPGGPPYIVS